MGGGVWGWDMSHLIRAKCFFSFFMRGGHVTYSLTLIRAKCIFRIETKVSLSSIMVIGKLVTIF